jgi:CRISP-associated protein Cas1
MMRQLLNTLYVQSQGAYLRLDHDNVVVEVKDAPSTQVPLHHLGGLAVFGNVLLSPFLLHRCGEDGRSVAWFSQSGRFQGRFSGPTTGNVLLRKAQHEAQADAARSLSLAAAIVAAKVRNSRHVLKRGARDGAAEASLSKVIQELKSLQAATAECKDVDALRGIEGAASALYFASFPDLIGPQASGFAFSERNRRPPRDPVNALLSFGYALLAQDCAAALEGVGLDPQVGFLHALRPGRPALALDLMEEFRALHVDRAVLTLLNRQQIRLDHFETRDGGAVLLTPEGRRVFLTHWQERKQETVHHHLLQEAVPLGLLPHVQARLLARAVRGDIGAYPAFSPR